MVLSEDEEFSRERTHSLEPDVQDEDGELKDLYSVHSQLWVAVRRKTNSERQKLGGSLHFEHPKNLSLD